MKWKVEIQMKMIKEKNKPYRFQTVDLNKKYIWK